MCRGAAKMELLQSSLSSCIGSCQDESHDERVDGIDCTAANSSIGKWTCSIHACAEWNEHDELSHPRLGLCEVQRLSELNGWDCVL